MEGNGSRGRVQGNSAAGMVRGSTHVAIMARISRWQEVVAAGAVGGLLALGLTACATSPKPSDYVPTGDAVVDGSAMLDRCPERDRVLWQYRTGLAALRAGERETAKAMLDAALMRIQSIYAPDATARRSRRYFVKESKKTFLGEPYERAMAYYYRGILYWMDGEPDNARACFRSAQLMDSDTEDRSYAGDYVLCDYLDGLATERLGGDGSEALARARGAVRQGELPDYDVRCNVLFFAETGRGPTKYATGSYGEQLRFRAGHSAAVRIRLQAGERVWTLEPWDDLTFQATTRGGRVMDHVLANKAVFKGATDAAGNVAIVTGAILATERDRNSAVDEVGVGLMIAGALSKLVSAATTPEADTRDWDNLPQFLYFGSVALGPGKHEIQAEFMDAAGRPLAEASRTFTLELAQPDQEAVVFLSDRTR
jgi:tetratricopeptide (TPR) repeat protein